jgi:hypothetical protein
MVKTTIKNLVELQKKTDKVIEKMEELNGKLHLENGKEFSDYYHVSGVDTDELENLNQPERKVSFEVTGWFRIRDEKMKGDLRRYGIYRTFITNISPTQIFPVIMDIPENVWNELKMSIHDDRYKEEV